MQKSVFLPAFLAGMAAPVSLYAAPRNYLAYIPGPAESFFAVNGAIAAAFALQVETMKKIAQSQTSAGKEQNARAADVRPLESAA